MANKKISELDSRASMSLGDLLAVGDPTTGYLYKTTISDLKTLTGAGVVSFNGRYGSVVPVEGDYSLTQLGDVIITTATNNDVLKYNGSNWVNAQLFTGTIAQYVDGTGAYQTFPTLLSSDRLVTEVRNTTGATVTKGTVIYLSGSSGTLPLIAKAQANGESTSTGTYGVVQNDIANNANGYVVVIGNLTGINTSAYNAGDILWLSPTVAGGVTTTKPSAPNHAVYIGIVTRSNSTQGTIEVKIANGYEIEELHNVSISSVANNEVLVYESASSLWKNKTIPTILGYTPANAATYVPYTGATADVNIGAYNLSASNVIVTNAGSGFLAALTADTLNGIGILNLTSGGKNGNLKPATLGADRNWTLPNASGTIALTSDIPSLSGYVPTSRTITINGTAYDLSADRAWTISSSQWITSGGDIYFNGGNVGINTASPTSRLTIGRVDSTSEGGQIDLCRASDNANAWGIDVYGSTSTPSFRIIDNVTATTRFTIDGSGNVGIGTTNPAFPLEVSSTSTTLLARFTSNQVNAAIRIVNSNASGGRTYSIGSGANGSGAGNNFYIYDETNGALRFAIDNSGNVGIGTSTPQITGTNRTTLDISGASTSILVLSTGTTWKSYLYNDGTNLSIANNGGYINFSDGNTQRMQIKNTNNGTIVFGTGEAAANSINFYGNYSNSQPGYVIYGSSSNLLLEFNGNTKALYIGNLGTGLVYSNGGVLTSTNPSDIRLKENVLDIAYGLKDILKLRPVSYKWKNDKVNQGIQFGFIAQEVQQVMPESIKEFGDDVKYLGLEKDAIYATLVNAIQEQQAQIEELKAKLK